MGEMTAAGTAAFWAHVPGPRTTAADDRLRALYERAHTAHPELAVAADAFFTHLGERFDGGELDDYLDRIDPAELYLVCACLAGVPAALRRFDESYLVEVRAGASRLRCSADELDEVTQEVRRMLLVAEPGARPRLATVTARGDLRALIRLMAVRAAISLRRKRGRLELADDDRIVDVLDAGAAPSLELIQRQHRHLLAAALSQAMARLDATTRTALKLHYLDGVPLAAIATMQRVDRSTIVRRLARARQDLLTHTRRTLATEAGIPTAHFDSFLDVLRSNFDLTLRRLLD